MPASLHTLPAHRLAALIRARKLGSLELLDHFLARVAAHNGALKAVCVLDAERARKRARAADRALSRGENRGPLHGLPMTVKESFDVAGLPTTWGRPDLKSNVPAANARAVQRLLDAGAVIFGKTNVPTLLADWQTFNPLYGTTCNPWDLSRGPGGSSGGAAAALAAGLTGLELGSDIGASIRNPAHFCGVYGHKPTRGVASAEGQTMPPFITDNDIAVIGPLARSARDLEIALQLIAVPDAIDARAVRVALPRPKPRTWRQWRVAVLDTAGTAPVDAAVRAGIGRVAEFLRRQGARVSHTARPDIDLEEAHRVYVLLLRAATSRNQSDADFARNLDKARRLPGGATGYAAWMLQANTLHHREWHRLNEARHHMRLAWDAFFRDWDLLLCPAAATTAFAHNQAGERWQRMVTVDGAPQPSTTALFWAGFSGMASLPSTVIPAGLADDGLPTGVQIVGPQYGDLTTLALARALERDFGGFRPPPAYA